MITRTSALSFRDQVRRRHIHTRTGSYLDHKPPDVGAATLTLMAPELVAEFIKVFTAEWNRLVADTSADAEAAERELVAVDRKLAGLIDALSEGFRAPGLQAKLDALEARKATLQQQLAAPAVAAPRLHPNLSAVYQAKVALQADTGAREALEAVHSLINRVNATPASTDRGHEIELIAEIAAMIRLGMDGGRTKAASVVPADHAMFVRSVKVVAGVGFEPTTFRL